MGQIHYRAAKSLSGITVAAIVDPTYDENIPETVYKHYSELFEHLSIDACIIASPTVTHAAIAADIIKRRIPVLIEKPLTRTLAEAIQLRELNHHFQTPLFISFTERFNPVIQSLLPDLENQTIRELTFTRTVQNSPNISSDGLLLDITIHDIDLTRFLTKKERTNHTISGISAENGFEIRLVLEDTIISRILSKIDSSTKERRFTISTSKAIYDGNLLTQTILKTDKDKTVSLPIHADKDAAQLQLEQFIQFLNRRNPGNLATMDDGIKSLEIVEYQPEDKY